MHHTRSTRRRGATPATPPPTRTSWGDPGAARTQWVAVRTTTPPSPSPSPSGPLPLAPTGAAAAPPSPLRRVLSQKGTSGRAVRVKPWGAVGQHRRPHVKAAHIEGRPAEGERVVGCGGAAALAAAASATAVAAAPPHTAAIDFGSGGGGGGQGGDKAAAASAAAAAAAISPCRRGQGDGMASKTSSVASMHARPVPPRGGL